MRTRNSSVPSERKFSMKTSLNRSRSLSRRPSAAASLRNAPTWTAKLPACPACIRGDNLQPDHRRARSHHGNLFRRGQRQVDDASLDERSPVGNANNSGTPVLQVEDFHHGIERERAVGRRHFVHVIDFPVGGAAPMIGVSVPAGVSNLPCSRPDRIRWAAGWRRGGERCIRGRAMPPAGRCQEGDQKNNEDFAVRGHGACFP